MGSARVVSRRGVPRARSGDLQMAVRRQGSTLWIDLQGELDLATSADLSALIDRVTREPGQILVIDLRALAFCNCAGLKVLVHQHYRLRRHGGSLVLLRPPPPIQRLLTLIGFDHKLHIRRSLASRPRSSAGR